MLKGAFIRLTLPGRGIHGILNRSNDLLFQLRKKWKCIRDLKIHHFPVWVWIDYLACH